MTVFLTGDVHGPIGIGKLASPRFDARGLTRGDCVIVLGDLGLPWSWPESREDAYWLDWLESKPWTTLFVDGNHENFHALAQYPAETFAGGSVYVLRGHVMHLRRAEVFEIGGKTYFAMGGARSTDRQWRTPFESWWPQEVPCAEQRAASEEKAREAGRVDYVLTHCPPVQELHDLALRHGFDPQPDEYAVWLQDALAPALEFDRWFYGHVHIDEPAREPFTPLYDTVFDMDAMAPSERVRVPDGPGRRARQEAAMRPMPQGRTHEGE